MDVIDFDAGEKIDQYAMVYVKLTGQFKAAIPTDDVKYVVMQVKTVKPIQYGTSIN